MEKLRIGIDTNSFLPPAILVGPKTGRWEVAEVRLNIWSYISSNNLHCILGFCNEFSLSELPLMCYLSSFIRSIRERQIFLPISIFMKNLQGNEKS